MRSPAVALRVLPAALAVAAMLPVVAHAASCPYAAGPSSVRVPDRLFAAKPTADGCWLFVSMIGGSGKPGAIAVLHNEAGAFRLDHVTNVPGQPSGLALSHDGRTLAAAAQDRVLLLDVAKLEAVDPRPMLGEIPEEAGDGAIYAQFTLDDRTLFVSEERRERLTVIDVPRAAAGAGAAAIVGRVPQARGPVGLALSADGARLYATSEIAAPAMGFSRGCAPQGGTPGREQPEGVLFVIDVAAAVSQPERAVLAAAAAGCGPVRVALSSDGAVAWVTARGDDALLAFRTRDLNGIQPTASPVRIKMGIAPVGVAVRPDGAQVWIANSDRFSAASQGSLSVLSAPGGEIRQVASGKFPRELAFLPDGKTLVVTVFGSSEVQLIPTDRP